MVGEAIVSKLSQHPILLHSEALQVLCKPLAHAQISTFSRLRVFNDNRFTVLCNHPDFVVNYLEKKYYNADPCVHIKSEMSDIGQYLAWDMLSVGGMTAAMMQDAADLKFRHVFTIIKTQADYSDFYHFGTHVSNPSINQFYINHLDLLDRFITYFDDQISQFQHLSIAHDMCFMPDKQSLSLSINHKDCRLDTAQIQELFHTTFVSPAEALTSKEIACAKLLLDGMTAKQIAAHCGLSYRTIEDRITAMKHKLGAKNKTALAIKLVKLLS